MELKAELPTKSKSCYVFIFLRNKLENKANEFILGPIICYRCVYIYIERLYLAHFVSTIRIVVYNSNRSSRFKFDIW